MSPDTPGTRGAPTPNGPMSGASIWIPCRSAVFYDYNQNSRDHTIASAYSVRGVPEALDTLLEWAERDERDEGTAPIG